jgi:hypothetical protein
VRPVIADTGEVGIEIEGSIRTHVSAWLESSLRGV